MSGEPSHPVVQEPLRMTSLKARPPFWIAAVVGAILIAFIALPHARHGEAASSAPSVADEAARLYDSFIQRATSGPLAATDSTGEASALDGRGELRIHRDLFKPAPKGWSAAQALSSAEPRAGKADSATAPRPRVKTPRLEGIFIDGRLSHAVINGNVVAEGDSVAGGWVVQIRRDAVVWLSPKQKYVKLTWRQTP